MKILLVGEYSRLHNSLKEGLIKLGHEVVLVGDSDSFKRFPVDFSIEAKLTQTKNLNIINRIFTKITGYNISCLERGLRMLNLLPKFKGYDVVQFINETPIQTFVGLEKFILKRLISNNKKSFLLSCGTDFTSVNFMNNGGFKYSLLDPLKQDPSIYHEYIYVLKYLKKPYQELSEFLYTNVNGVIASDFDYALPLKNNSKFIGLIPNPINTDVLNYNLPDVSGKVVFFLGVNKFNYHKKGIPFFEKALTIIQQKFPESVEVIKTENLPYQDYIKAYNRSHIVLDQIYAYDQGYNALEAMAIGKVVFTGAESEFLNYYNLYEDEVCVNALPNVEYLVEKFTFFINNRNKIIEVSENALKFIKSKHYYVNVSADYSKIWSDN